MPSRQGGKSRGANPHGSPKKKAGLDNRGIYILPLFAPTDAHEGNGRIGRQAMVFCLDLRPHAYTFAFRIVLTANSRSTSNYLMHDT